MPLYVVMDSVLCLKKKMTLKDGDPVRYSSRWRSEIYELILHERTYLFRVGQVGILCQVGLEVCVSCASPTVLWTLGAPLFLVGKGENGGTYQWQPWQSSRLPLRARPQR